MNKKQIVGVALALVSALSYAGANDPFDMRYVQNNSGGNGTLNRYIPFPAGGASCIHYLDGPSVLPGCLLLGDGLTISNGKLNAAGGGVPGPAGKNAYEVAQMDGYLGSRAEWLASLKGAPGNDGAQGIPGVKGDTGAQGIPGASIKGDKGDTGPQGVPGKDGAAGVNAFSAPVSRTVVAGTAYQTSALKPTHVMLTLTSTSTISLTGSSNNAASIYIGPTAAVATGSGTVVGKYTNVLGGGLVVGLNLNTTQSNTYSLAVPAGWYYAVVVTTGTGLVIDNVVEQTAG